VVVEGCVTEWWWTPNVLVYEVVAMGQQADTRKRRRDGVGYELGFLGGEDIVETVV
jgi:hypothetical protein